MPIWIYGVPPVPFITGICCRIEFLGRWDECEMYGGCGFRRLTSRRPGFLLQIVEAPRWFICLHWSPGGDTFVFMLRIQQTLFHFTSYRCQIKPACNQYQSLSSFYFNLNHMIDVKCPQEVNIKVYLEKLTVAFCFWSFFWYLSKQALFCDEWCPDSVFCGKQNKKMLIHF